MIGQSKNLEIIKQWKKNDRIPHCIIIEGNIGTGRLTLSKEIISALDANGVICSLKISDIRDIMAEAYSTTNKTVYIFRDCDEMSVASKNSLLKILEEPPNNIYFILTAISLQNVLDTIKSRSTILKMQPYTKEELQNFTDSDLIIQYVDTPGMIEQTEEKTLKEALKLTNNIIDELEKHHGVGILKYTTQLKSKATEEDKVDPLLFFNLFVKLLLERQVNLPYKAIREIELCKQQLTNKSVNVKMSVETTLIKIVGYLK